ncbi:putative ribosomal N-acetyltransferase YdaF [compost metagenome]
MRPGYQYPSLETKRIIMKPLSQEDIQKVFDHFTDPDVTKYMDIEPCKNRAESEEIIKFHQEDLGCRWGMYLKKKNQFIGTCGYHCLGIGEKRKAEIGFDLSKHVWGQGLMKEAIQVLLQFGFETMELQFVEATVEQKNIRSYKLLERLSFERADELQDNLLYYSLNKEVWKHLEEGSNSV